MASHLAAVCLSKGQPFEVRSRPTPKPGPGELLVAVKTIALNPADTIMRGHGLFISTYPTVIGFDMSGLVLEVGDNVPTQPTHQDGAIFFQPGVTRVAAYAASFWRSFDPDYGVFQEKCLVPWQHAAPIPDQDMSWNHAATLPVAAQVPLSAFDALGIPRTGKTTTSTTSGVSSTTPEDFEGGPQKDLLKQKEAILIWGASSSVGTMGVQIARLLKEEPKSTFAAVYATAGSANQTYVNSLGADRVFDYKDSQVVDAIVSAAKEDGLVIRHCFLATGQLASCQAILKAFVESKKQGEEMKAAKIASAPIIPPDAEVLNEVETIFVQPSGVEEDRLEQFQYWMGTWLRENLVKGTIKPSPEPTIVGQGLDAINAGLDRLSQGVSCTKLVVEISE